MTYTPQFPPGEKVEITVVILTAVNHFMPQLSYGMFVADTKSHHNNCYQAYQVSKYTPYQCCHLNTFSTGLMTCSMHALPWHLSSLSCFNTHHTNVVMFHWVSRQQLSFIISTLYSNSTDSCTIKGILTVRPSCYYI